MSDSKVTINIFGGTQQINPSATSAVQNYYGDQFARDKREEEAKAQLDLSPEAQKLAAYLNKVEDITCYLPLLASCDTATDLAHVVMSMMRKEDRITKEEVVRQRFIERILPLAPKLAQSERGNSIDNIRARINDALMKQPVR